MNCKSCLACGNSCFMCFSWGYHMLTGERFHKINILPSIKWLGHCKKCELYYYSVVQNYCYHILANNGYRNLEITSIVCLLMLKHWCHFPALIKWLQAISSVALSHLHFYITTSELPESTHFFQWFSSYCWFCSYVLYLIILDYIPW